MSLEFKKIWSSSGRVWNTQDISDELCMVYLQKGNEKNRKVAQEEAE